MELISRSEFGRRLGISVAAVSKAIETGRIQTVERERNGKTVQLLDWETQSELFEANRRRKQNNGRGGGRKSSDPNKIEKHIGNPNTLDEIDFDSTSSDYSNIPDDDLDGLPPKGSVAFYQAKKLHWDAERNRIKYFQEAGDLLTTEDAIGLYADKLTEIADAVQNIPSRCGGLICSEIRRSVKEWNGTKGDSLESEVHKLLTEQVKLILQDLAAKKYSAAQITKDYVNGGKKKKR